MDQSIINEFLIEYYDKAIELKEKFKITEKKEWDAITVVSELIVQLGHISEIILSNDNYKDDNRNLKNIGDEISDIILQIIVLSWKLEINLKGEKFYGVNKKDITNEKESIIAFNIIMGQLTEAILEIYNYRHYKIRNGFPKVFCYMKSKLKELMIIIMQLAEKLEIDIFSEFNAMLNDANQFLVKYEVDNNIDYYPIVDMHATWLVLNPIQGCPKKCKYCFLAEKGLNATKPKILVSPEKAIDLLTTSSFYISDMPICLFSQTDAFSTKENIEYLKQLLILFKEKKLKNPIIFITKCKIPLDFIDLIKEYQKDGLKFIFFLSYSGLDSNIELGVDKKLIEENFVNLSKSKLTIIHYWRPFIPQNSTKEKMNSVYNFVKKYSIASVIIGLKVSENIIENIDWKDLKKNKSKAMASDNVWEKYAYDYVWNTLKFIDDDYPIFQTTSCALGYALKMPDRKFFYDTNICLNCNKCPKIQRQLCKLKNDNKKIPSKLDIINLLASINKNINKNQILIEENIIILKNIILNFNEISFLTDTLGFKIIVKKNENDYYWNTSINDAEILKI